ncbi:acetyl-CoA carboxylase biotin carboxylase subunit [Hyperthermus butylicus]|uniref:Pyruvate carboxylase subunit A n=1 Tax=Hyperthermus butylicus (strain DSM 5456 / JCM 9403 / PLM1-5) TaxID=415426 RepID=A2BLY3_HYPBU|nr:biotin carboxylase N-terminal domain-containing protein [Hyperthermus butylicus]ABM80994.1 pyruvate carboxylase subunit A [Hyperthermus butylicus DSM 5456]
MALRVLVATRGEIAIRIARAVRELGWEPITIYAPDDAHSPHVRAGTFSVMVESYTNPDSVVEAAIKAGADILHPGYGFLSEDPSFARKVLDAGISWAGPKPETMELLGDKHRAKQLAEKVGVPTPPWCEARSAEEAVRCAERIGYPVMLKASKAGGGRGMRVASNSEEVRRAYRLVSLEARNGFGDAGVVYIEKYVRNPRHIEVQILGDGQGHVVHLYERECSIQRRRQKIIEEAPSPFAEKVPQVRSRLVDYALRLAEEAEYQSAGTIEFIVDERGQPYFIEANARLQVEHGVTEAVTGIDIVKQQLLIAAGRELQLGQEDIKLHGWAIEARIYAEDPENGFRAVEGVVTGYREPRGPGVRVDSGAERGLRISTRYDTLLLKVIAWGRDRAEAVARLRAALHETVVAGVKTNLELLRTIVESDWFRKAAFHTRILEEKLGELLSQLRARRNIVRAIASRIRAKPLGLTGIAAAKLPVVASHGWPWPPWRT